MSEPIIPERTGDLAELGVSPHPTTPLDEVAAMEEESQPLEGIEPTPEPIEPEAPPVEEAVEEIPQEEPASEEGILQALQQEEVSEESEVTRLRQQVQRYEDMMERQIKLQEEQVRSMTQPAQPEPDPEPQSMLESEPVKQVLQRLAEEDPAQYQAALAKVIEQDISNKFQSRLDAIQAERAEQERKQKEQQQAAQAAQFVQNTFADIASKGGLEAELIQQLQENPQGSYLGQKINANPGILASEYGIRGVVQETAAQLRERYKAQQQSIAQQVSPSIEASAGRGSASLRGAQLGEKPPQMSPEEQIIDDMMNVGDRMKNLDFI